MARYIREVQLDRPADFVQFIMGDFLSKHGFKLKEVKGEMVYHGGRNDRNSKVLDMGLSERCVTY